MPTLHMLLHELYLKTRGEQAGMEEKARDTPERTQFAVAPLSFRRAVLKKKQRKHQMEPRELI